MAQTDDAAAEAAVPEQQQPPEDLEVAIARELLERARDRGVWLVGPDGLLAGVTRTVLQAALDAEMADHLGYDRGERPPLPGGNHRNGYSPKTVLTEVGAIPLQVPRDRAGKFDPQIVPKHARRAIISSCPGFQDQPACRPLRARPVTPWPQPTASLSLSKGRMSSYIDNPTSHLASITSMMYF